MYNCVSIWAPNQVEWLHPIRSELHVEILKRPKHAVHNEWSGTLMMTRIKNYSIQHPQLLCSLYLVSILLLGIELPCTKSILYKWSYIIHTLYVYVMVGDLCIGQHSGHSCPCTNAEGLFITDTNKHLSPLFTFSFLIFILKFSLILHPPNTHTHTHTHTSVV